MTRKRPIVSRVASSRAVDDLKVIRGIGLLTEKHLHDAGIRTFAQLAAKSPEDVAAHIPTLSVNQVRNQGWILQARKLASKRGEPKPGKEKTTALTGRQHYENFTIEFLLNDKNKIRRMRVMHVQSGDVDTWANWHPEEIFQFLARHTGVRVLNVHPTSKTTAHPVGTNGDVEPKTANIITSNPIPKEPIHQAFPETILKTPPADSSAPRNLIHCIHLLEWTNSPTNSQQSIRSLPHDKNFEVKLTLDISKASLANCTQLDITGMLYAKKLGGGSRQVIGESQWIVPYSPIINLDIDNATLAQGIYRLEASVRFNPTEAAPFPAGIDASFQGGLFQVY